MPATTRVHLFPRRKAGDCVFPEKGRLPVKVDRETIQKMFGMPQPDASRALGVSLTESSVGLTKGRVSGASDLGHVALLYLGLILRVRLHRTTREEPRWRLSLFLHRPR
jgi:hypothetical protein